MHGADPTRDTPEAAQSTLTPLAALDLARWQADRKLLLLYPRLCLHLHRLAADFARAPGGPFHLPAQARSVVHAGPLLLRRYVDLAARTRLSFVLADTPGALGLLARYPLAICPTLELLEADAMTAFERHVLDGSFLGLGPRIPVQDERLRHQQTLTHHFGGHVTDFDLAIRPFGGGSFITLPGRLSVEEFQRLAFESGLARGLAADTDVLDSVVLRRGPRRLLCIANPTPHDLRTAVTGERFRALRNLDSGETVPASGEINLAIPAETVSLWEVL
jgi:hypothetical protein